MDIVTPAISALTTWHCLKMWGLTFFQESFCLREISRIPASFARGDFIVRSCGRWEPHLALARNSMVAGQAATSVIGTSRKGTVDFGASLPET